MTKKTNHSRLSLTTKLIVKRVRGVGVRSGVTSGKKGGS